LDIRELISFYHAARLLSVSRAGTYLGIGQPTVSNHIQRLEDEFNCRLFDRITRPIQLTAEGTRLLELVTPIVQAVEQGMESLEYEMNQQEQRGSFIMGAYPDLVRNYLPRVINHYRKQYPEVRMKVLARPYTILLDMINAGDLDMALMNAPERKNHNLNFRQLFNSSFRLIAPLGHILLNHPKPTLESISRWPLISLSPQSCTRYYLERAFREVGLEHQVALETDFTELVKQYVELGMGIAVTQECGLCPGDEDTLGIINLDHLLPPVQIGVVTLQGKFLSRVAHHFIDTLVELSGANSQWASA
jgi:LysR family cys regulon transcriptional activator